MSMHHQCIKNCGSTDCDAPYAEVTATTDNESYGERMLRILNEVDFYHDKKAGGPGFKETREMHRRYQQAVWWAIQGIESWTNDRT